MLKQKNKNTTHYQNYITSIIAKNFTILLNGNISIVDSLEIIKILHLQPVIIIIIASFVAFIVFAIAIPIFDLSNGISIE